MISASPVEQGTLTLSPGGWEIEAHTGLDDLLTGIKALARSPVPSLLLRGLRHTQSKEEEEVTRGLLRAVQLPRVPALLCWGPGFQLSLCRAANTRTRAELQSSTAGKVFEKPEEPARGTSSPCAYLQGCASTLLFLLIPRGHTHQENHSIPIRALCSLLETMPGKSSAPGRRFWKGAAQ